MSTAPTTTGTPPAARTPGDGTARTFRTTTPATGRRTLIAWSFLLPFALLFTITLVVPLFVGLRDSFFTRRAAGGGLFGGGEMVEEFAGLDNYVTVATDPEFWRGMARVLVYGAWQIPIMIGLALTLALLLDSFMVRRVGGFRLAYFLPFAVPGVVGATIWMYLYNPNLSPLMRVLPDWLDLMSPRFLLLGIANVVWWQFVGFNLLVFLAALQAIPRELDEAARIDGASGFQVALRVKLPLLRNAAVLTILLSIIGTIQLFSEPLIFSTTSTWISMRYTPMMMAIGSQQGVLIPGGPGPAGAISVMMSLVAGALAAGFVLVQRRVR